MKNRIKDFFKENGYAACIYGCVALVAALAVCIAILDHNSIKSNTAADTAEYQQAREQSPANEQEQPVNGSRDKSYKEQTTESAAPATENGSQTSANNKANEKTTDTQPQTTAKSESGLFAFDESSQDMLMPVEGQIVMDYSPETAVFDATLEQYRTNDTICIAGDVGTNVAASADGVVYDEGYDEVKGNFVVLDHGNGWMSTYSQLGENLGMAVGDIVNMGDTIGKIAEPTAFRSELGPHVEFYLTHNNEATDPKLLFAPEE